MTATLAERLRAAGAAAEAGFTGEVDAVVLPCGLVLAQLWPDVEGPLREDAEEIAVLEGEVVEAAEVAPQLVAPGHDDAITVLEGE